MSVVSLSAYRDSKNLTTQFTALASGMRELAISLRSRGLIDQAIEMEAKAKRADALVNIFQGVA